MKHCILKFCAFLLCIVAHLPLSAQKVSFDVTVPDVVAVGEVFRVEFTADAKPNDFKGPQFEGPDVLAGPTLSSSYSMQIINGNMTKESRYTYTYLLQCNSPGEFTIASAIVTVDGKEYSTRPRKVKAVAETDAAKSQQQTSAAGSSNTGGSAATNGIAADDIIIRAIPDRREVYKGQPVKVTYKLYTRVPLNLESAQYPSYNGFWAQQLNVDAYSPKREEYNGKIYDTHIIREDLLFPQQSGNIQVDPLELNVVAQIIVEQRRRSILDDFFGGPNISSVRKKIATQPLTIKVNDLPAAAPASFTGAVGDFSIETITPPADVVANSAFTYTIRISGSGNLPQIQAPILSLPATFEQYSVKTTESLNNTADGIFGYRQFEYPVIARAVGDYDVQPVEFTYFNPKLKTYETLSSKPFSIHVSPDSTSLNSASTTGLVSGLSKEDLKIIGHDIRFIKIDSPRLRLRCMPFFASLWYFVAIALMLGLFAILAIWLKKLVRQRHNVALIKGKRANKVALARFKSAAQYMNSDNQRGFYEEMLKAMWGYVGDKLNIPASNQTKVYIREELLKRNIPADDVQTFINIIADCEYAQYAPSATAKMNELYAQGIEIVSKLENIIGK